MVITSDIAVSGIVILNSRYSLHLDLLKRHFALPKLSVTLAFCPLKERVLAGMLVISVLHMFSSFLVFLLFLKASIANQTVKLLTAC